MKKIIFILLFCMSCSSVEIHNNNISSVPANDVKLSDVLEFPPKNEYLMNQFYDGMNYVIVRKPSYVCNSFYSNGMQLKEVKIGAKITTKRVITYNNHDYAFVDYEGITGWIENDDLIYKRDFIDGNLGIKNIKGSIGDTVINIDINEKKAKVRFQYSCDYLKKDKICEKTYSAVVRHFNRFYWIDYMKSENLDSDIVFYYDEDYKIFEMLSELDNLEYN
jgi:hypothetical protein